MKKQLFSAALLLLSSQCVAQESWLDKIKSFLGVETETTQSNEPSPSSSAIIEMLSQNLGITTKQAEGGLAALVNYIKQTASSEEFQTLTQNIPGIESILSAIPVLPAATQQTGVDSLLDKAVKYSSSMKAVNDLKKQFEVLGLKPETIEQFVTHTQNYLNKTQMQDVGNLFNSKLLDFRL